MAIHFPRETPHGENRNSETPRENTARKPEPEIVILFREALGAKKNTETDITKKLLLERIKPAELDRGDIRMWQAAEARALDFEAVKSYGDIVKESGNQSQAALVAYIFAELREKFIADGSFKREQNKFYTRRPKK